MAISVARVHQCKKSANFKRLDQANISNLSISAASGLQGFRGTATANEQVKHVPGISFINANERVAHTQAVGAMKFPAPRKRERRPNSSRCMLHGVFELLPGY